MNFSTNQVRHLYVANSWTKVLANAAVHPAVDIPFAGNLCGKLYQDWDNQGDAIRFFYRNPLNEVISSDIIPVKNIRKVNFTPFVKMRQACPAVKISWVAGDIVADNEYIIKFRFPEHIGLSPESDYVKVVNFIHTATGVFQQEMINAILSAFSKDNYIQPLINVFPTGLTEIKIVSLPQEWHRGRFEYKAHQMHCYLGTRMSINPPITENSWGTVSDATDVNIWFLQNGRKMADLEYFCMGERGDIYRGMGYPNVIETSYAISLGYAMTRDFDAIDLHYFFQGEGVNSDYSEKVITFIFDSGIDGQRKFEYAQADPVYAMAGDIRTDLVPTFIFPAYNAAPIPYYVQLNANTVTIQTGSTTGTQTVAASNPAPDQGDFTTLIYGENEGVEIEGYASNKITADKGTHAAGTVTVPTYFYPNGYYSGSEERIFIANIVVTIQ